MKSETEYQLNWIPQHSEVSVSADMGWTWGKYEFNSKDKSGNTITRKGKYLNVWTKQPDGSWKVKVDMGNVEPEN